jgi:23S rRNA (adenine2503-C2)-methyltransferase
VALSPDPTSFQTVTPIPVPGLKAVPPLGLTSDQFVDAYAGRLVVDRWGGRAGAMEAYRKLFRAGPGAVPGLAIELPPIVRTLREESPEGEVVKFLTRIGMREMPVAGASVEAPTTINPDITTSLRLAVTSSPTPLEVESVLIPMIGAKGLKTYTLCVSSQVGCAMGCTFCETAQMGLIRSLEAHEIVAQWYLAKHVLGFEVKNIVFMGMGEPLDNYENVVQAIAVLIDHNGAGVPVSQITVSTVGRVDGIRKLAEQIKTPGWHRLGIALSLNATSDEVRSAIMPINRKYRLADVQRALLDWPRFAGNKICVEYVLIPTVNDSERNLDEIAAFMGPFGGGSAQWLKNGAEKQTIPPTPSLREGASKPRALLNLIPYNPRRNSPWPAPEESKVDWFIAELIKRGVFVKRRRTKGREMMGACGQLGAENIRQRRIVRATVSG